METEPSAQAALESLEACRLEASPSPCVSDQGAKAMSLKLMKPSLDGNKLTSSCADRAAPAAASGGICGTGCNQARRATWCWQKPLGGWVLGFVVGWRPSLANAPEALALLAFC
jgi:hypothetical protein